MDMKQVKCWHLEYCSFDAGQMAWRPMILTLETEDACKSQMAAWQNVKSICCARVTGPYWHDVPAEERP